MTRVQPPSELAAEVSGELAGTGRWTLSPSGDGTLVRCNWDIRTTRPWMNLVAPLARPVFSWNHDELMREGGRSLARQLGVDRPGRWSQLCRLGQLCRLDQLCRLSRCCGVGRGGPRGGRGWVPRW